MTRRPIPCPFRHPDHPDGHLADYLPDLAADRGGSVSCAICETVLAGDELEALLGVAVEEFLDRHPRLLPVDLAAVRELEELTARAVSHRLRPSELAELLLAWASARWPRVDTAVHRGAIRRAATRALQPARTERAA